MIQRASEVLHVIEHGKVASWLAARVDADEMQLGNLQNSQRHRLPPAICATCTYCTATSCANKCLGMDEQWKWNFAKLLPTLIAT